MILITPAKGRCFLFLPFRDFLGKLSLNPMGIGFRNPRKVPLQSGANCIVIRYFGAFCIVICLTLWAGCVVVFVCKTRSPSVAIFSRPGPLCYPLAGIFLHNGAEYEITDRGVARCC